MTPTLPQIVPTVHTFHDDLAQLAEEGVTRAALHRRGVLLSSAGLTPRTWAVDGFADLVYRGGSLPDMIGEVGVLLAYAVVLMALAAWRLRRNVAGI